MEAANQESPNQQFAFRRMPAVLKAIRDVNEKDIRLRLVGTVIDCQNGSILLDDGTGQAEVISEQSAKVGSFVRIFTRVLQLENKYELRAETVQDLSDVNKRLYKQIYG
ncbi:MAG: replication protein RepA [Candidatus Aenigmarchaeota archaeon]|nr:replication protein RepA [Candidatus Aenigmarchaeota archaeon]